MHIQGRHGGKGDDGEEGTKHHYDVAAPDGQLDAVKEKNYK